MIDLIHELNNTSGWRVLLYGIIFLGFVNAITTMITEFFRDYYENKMHKREHENYQKKDNDKQILGG